MALGCTIMKDMFMKYQGSGMNLILFAVAFIYLFIVNKEFRQRLGLPMLLLLVIILNPVFYWYLWIKIMEATVWRMFWMFGEAIVCVYALIDINGRINRKYVKMVPIVLGVLICMLSGKFLYTEKAFDVAENNYKIPQKAIETADFLLQQKEKPRAVFSRKLYNYIRQYTNDIDMLYGRDIKGYTYQTEDVERQLVYLELKKRNPDCAVIAKICHERQIDYLVFEKKKNTNFEEYGYELLGTVDNYFIYQSTW